MSSNVMMDDDAIIVSSRPTEIMSPATRAEVDIQIATAKRYPRNIAAFKDAALTMATLDEETASGCFYSMPRGGKPIEGPSVRLAEIVLSSWGNIRADARVIDVGQREITAEGVCWDLEKNIAIRVQVKRRITDRQNNRYNDDMIVVTGNAACSIALRNAIFKVIPMAYTRDIYLRARDVAIGDVQTLAAKRAQMVEYFGKMGIPTPRVCAAVNRVSVEDITLDDLATLKGMATAIREGDLSIDAAFPLPQKPEDDKGGAATKADALADKLAASTGKQTSSDEPPKEKPTKGRKGAKPEPEQPKQAPRPQFDIHGNAIGTDDIDEAMKNASPNQHE